MDLPDHAVIVGGLDHWTKGEEIQEPRLVEKLKKLIPCETLTLHAPPPDDNDPTATRTTGITAWQFPEWFVTQDVFSSGGGRARRSRRLIHRKSLTRGKFIDDDRKARPVVPVRFVRACRKGHIGDIHWYNFVHHRETTCRRSLWMDERGTASISSGAGPRPAGSPIGTPASSCVSCS